MAPQTWAPTEKHKKHTHQQPRWSSKGPCPRSLTSHAFSFHPGIPRVHRNRQLRSIPLPNFWCHCHLRRSQEMLQHSCGMAEVLLMAPAEGGVSLPGPERKVCMVEICRQKTATNECSNALGPAKQKGVAGHPWPMFNSIVRCAAHAENRGKQ